VQGAYAHFPRRPDWLAPRGTSAISDFLDRFARVQPRLAMLGVLSPDKFAHAFGSDSEFVREGIRDVDAQSRERRRSPSQAGGAIRCVSGWWAIMDTRA
jgi:hypothetical protein